ncbi:MAG: RNA polymerase sigma factor [Pseudonocardiaceae bacterium]
MAVSKTTSRKPFADGRETISTKSEVGDTDGFEAFYTTTVEWTYRAACRIAAGDTQLALDATQDAYVVMLQRWHERRHKPPGVNHNYVVRIAANKVIDQYRRWNRRNSLDDCDPPDGENPVDDLVNELSVLRAVRELIDRQPPRRRAVAMLYFLEEAGYAEIAVSLQITESTVRTHVERMRNLLKPLIDQINQIDEGGVGHDRA